MSIYNDLSWRGLINQESDPDELRQILTRQKVTLYAGFDPTADSLHIGNLIPLIALRRLQNAGHRVIALLGGGTGLIGDPSGKASERRLNEKEIVDAWVSRIRLQMEPFLDFSSENPAILVDNYEWIGRLSAIDLLRDLGKHFTVSWMLGKESVRSRVGDPQSGISYTEFSYMILQALDFLELQERYQCTLQVGGSDQWGNITAGIELIRRKSGTATYGLTFPLITTASGAKFGKSEGGAIWLDAKKTSPYAFYQYWLNVDDRDVGKFLRYFTFLPQDVILELEESVVSSPESREAQRRLASEMTAMVHGKTELSRAESAARALFGGGALQEVESQSLEVALSSAPSVEYSTIQAIPDLPTVLVETKLAESKGAARKLITAGAIYANNMRIDDVRFRPEATHFLHGRYWLLRRGKRQVAVVKLPA